MAATVLEGNVLILEKKVERVLACREGASAERALTIALRVCVRIESPAEAVGLLKANTVRFGLYVFG